jgi:OOP family OmpA-OmpF porin
MKTKSFLAAKTKIFHLLNANIINNRTFLFVLGCLWIVQAQSQTDKRLVLADQYFASGEYFTAADLYGQFLNPTVKSKYHSDFPLNTRRNTDQWIGRYQNKTDIVLKQADSYRLANFWANALELYKKCFEKDSIKYAGSMYWLAVCQRSIGDYTNAEESLNRFLAMCTQKNEYYNVAIKERQTLQFIKKELSKSDTVLFHVQKINTTFGDKGIFAPTASNENQYLFTSAYSNQTSGNINPNHNRLFHSTLTNDGLQTAAPIEIKSVDSSFNQGAASISSDGKHLYYTQWKKENNQTVSSIYFSNKTDKGWSKPQRLYSINQQGHNSKQPFCSADGNYLFFASDRTGGAGGFDIWYAPLLTDGSTGQALNAGAVINSPANEQAPFYHNGSSTLIFASDRSPSMGGFDLFASKGVISQWKAPENMGYPINSSRDDVYFFAGENQNLFNNAIVSSDRGSACCLATYAIVKTDKKKIIKGLVVDCSNKQPIAEAELQFRDASGKTVTTTTTPDGQYSLDLPDNVKSHLFVISKERYHAKTTEVAITTVNQSNWQADTAINTIICLEKKFVFKAENVVTVYFDFDKSDIKARSARQMDSIYKILTENPTYTLQVSGYTDGKGSTEYNERLSDRRAKSCADYLISRGIDPARISFESFGACCPAEMELVNGRDNENGRAKNRRALININKTGNN